MSDKKLPKGFTVTWHTGAMDTPDNSLTFVKAAVKGKAKVTEFDVSFRPDGTPCVIHKDFPAEGEGESLDLMLAEAAKSKTMWLNLDLKNWANLPAVEEMLKKHGMMERAFYTGVSEKQCGVTAETSVLPYFLNDFAPVGKRREMDARALAAKIKKCGAVGLNTQFGGLSKTLVRVLHEEGLLVSAWTVDKPADQKKVLAMGVDNITTRRSDMMAETLKNAGK